MATPITTAYGFNAPLIAVFPTPILAKVDPTTGDKTEVGQVWVNTVANTFWMALPLLNGLAQWQQLTTLNGPGVFTNLTATGTVNLAPTTSTVTLSTPNNGITIQSNTTAGAQGIAISGNTGAVTISSAIAGLGGVVLNNTTGGITLRTPAAAAGTGVQIAQGTQSIQVFAAALGAAGTPVTVANQGSLFINTTGAVGFRFFIATDNAGTWTDITTAA